MNLEQKVDAILTAVQTPAPVTIDPTVLQNAIAAALATALEPVIANQTAIIADLTTISASVTDIQGQVDEPAAPAQPAEPVSPTDAPPAA